MFKDRSIAVYLLSPIGFSSNVYIIVGTHVTMIDVGVGGEANRIMPKLAQIGINPTDVRFVILTHEHFDHVGGLGEIADYCSPVILAHESTIEDLSRLYDLDFREARDEERVPINGRVDVVFTPGHSAGSICIHDAARRILFSGDTVFADGWFGRTDLPTGSTKALVESIKRLRTCDVEVIFPGHGDIVAGGGSRCLETAYGRAVSMIA